MSHEMRTPLNAIMGMTTIGKGTNDDEKRKYAFNTIAESSSHLLNMVENILDMAKFETDTIELKNEEFDFPKLLDEVVSNVRPHVEKKQHDFSVNIDKNTPNFIVGDKNRYTQVLNCLLDNSIKFTPEGGKISLDISGAEKIKDKCVLHIKISDTGIGISAEKQDKLFDVFEQADNSMTRTYGGTGLGLSISSRIIEKMGGKLWVKSELGKGATFNITVKVEYR